MNDLISVILGYGAVLLIGIFVLSFLFRGFFWQFLRVRASLGRKILIKARAINRDYFIVGKVEGEFLVFKSSKEEKRIAISDRNVFYKSLGIIWVDLDETKNTLVKPDYTGATGFDAVLYNNLYLRALYKPAITDNLDKIMILMVIVGIILNIVVIVLLVKAGKTDTAILNQLTTFGTQIKGSVVQTTVL